MPDNEDWPKPPPVYPRDPDLHNLLDSRGIKRLPHRSSRRKKFLGLEEFSAPLGSSGGNEIFVHGVESYDLARGPRPPVTHRPLVDEWSTPHLGVDDMELLEKVTKKRQKEGKTKTGRTRNRKRS